MQQLEKDPFWRGAVEKMEAEEGRGSIHWRKQGDQGLLSLDQAISLVLNAASILFLLGSSAAECGEAVRSIGSDCLNLNLGEGHQRRT